MKDISSYIYGEDDDMPWETNLPGYGVTFPHPFGEPNNPLFTTFITLSPVGDELTLDFAQQLIKEEEIGMDHITDYLSVSFSATDYVGHIFGPSSLEAEDNLLRLDRTLAALLESVDKQIGLENTLVVFSSDHGAPDAPGHLNKIGIDAGYFDINTVDTVSIRNSMNKRFDVDEKLVEGFYPPYVYLNNDVILSHNLDIDEVSRHMARALQNQQGIAFAIAVADLLEGKIADTELNLAVLRNLMVWKLRAHMVLHGNMIRMSHSSSLETICQIKLFSVKWRRLMRPLHYQII
jgi:hypothetical protein